MSESWPTPNYVDPPSRASMVVGTNIGMVVAAIFFVVLRVFTRFKLASQGIDDILICFACVFSFGMSLCIALSTKYGLGRHIWDIPEEWFPPSWKLAYAFTALYTPTLMATKCSILAFYLNKLGTETKFRTTCWVLIAYVVGSSVGVFFANIFQCTPISGGWNLAIPGRKCIRTDILYYYSGVNNLFTDLVLLVLPLPVIWKLRLPLRQKLGLVMVFSMGVFVTVISIVRIHMVKVAVSSDDLSWTGAVSSTWSAIELNVAIICACMPAVKQFLSWIAPGIMGSTVKSKTNYYGPGSSGGLKYHDGTNTRKSLHGLKSSRSAHGHGPNITTITATHHNGDSEEYIMNDLDARSGGSGSGTGINKTVEVIVESELVKEEVPSDPMTDSRSSW